MSKTNTFIPYLASLVRATNSPIDASCVFPSYNQSGEAWATVDAYLNDENAPWYNGQIVTEQVGDKIETYVLSISSDGTIRTKNQIGNNLEWGTI